MLFYCTANNNIIQVYKTEVNPHRTDSITDAGELHKPKGITVRQKPCLVENAVFFLFYMYIIFAHKNFFAQQSTVGTWTDCTALLAGQPHG